MAQAPTAILLMDTNADFIAVRDFCFDEELEYIETEVGGYRGVAIFGGAGQVLQFCAQQLILVWVYPLANPMGIITPLNSSEASSPSGPPSCPPASENESSLDSSSCLSPEIVSR